MDARFAQSLLKATRGRVLIHQDVRRRLTKAEAYLKAHPGHKGAERAVATCKKILGGESLQKSIAEHPQISLQKTEQLARKLGIDLKKYSLEQLHMGINVELEHKDLLKHDDDRKTALKIACDHLDEYADYYTRLKKVEKGSGGYDPWLGQSRASKNAEMRTSGALPTKPSGRGSRGGGRYGFASFPERTHADQHAAELNKINAAHEAKVYPHPKGTGFEVAYTRQSNTPKAAAVTSAKPTKSSI